MASERGITTWSSAAWQETATAWMDERLAAAGLSRTGGVQQPHLRPWATVLTADTTGGRVFLKAAGAGTAFEAGLYDLLARVAPDHVLVPLATDPGRGWMLLPDGGPPVGERLAGDARLEALGDALARYGVLQRSLAARTDELLALGLADMRPAAMPARFREALAAVEALGGHPDTLRRVEAVEATVVRRCERLAALPGGASLDHNDLHPFNVLAAGRFYDWGDSVVAHPFAVALVPLSMIRSGLGAAGEARARDAYLEVFSDLAPRAELAEALGLARKVAKVARVLTWDRATRAAREQGEDIEPEWAAAVQ